MAEQGQGLRKTLFLRLGQRPDHHTVHVLHTGRIRINIGAGQLLDPLLSFIRPGDVLLFQQGPAGKWIQSQPVDLLQHARHPFFQKE